MTYLKTYQLSIDVWTAQVQKHQRLVSPFADAFVKRRACRLKHPVHDFLFTYYSFSPLKLKQWVPSFEEKLEVTDQVYVDYPWLKDERFSLEDNYLCIHRANLRSNTRELARFIIDLCTNILQRVPRFGCFGLHEWAMVYKLSLDAIRHQGYLLRLTPYEIASFVESQTICCTHYDAYRFFSEEARPLNVLNPLFETRLQMEQGGCLHANMDLYKWSTKLWPWIGSDFIAKTFFLALESRELDMRASPYDLRESGYMPVRIETEEGRKQYQKEQQAIAEKAVLLRQQLKSFCERLLLLKA